jgi:amino-acid N-acetyltransferase
MKPTDLRGILQYVPQFREKTFVVAMDGAAVADENFANILMDVAVLWSLNIRTVLVHGASILIRALAAEKGVVPSDLEGSGVTDEETLKLSLTASNRLTHEMLEGLAAADLRAAATNAVIAHPVGILRGVDHVLTGRVERVDVGLLDTLLANGIVPVVPPLGVDGEGGTYRVNSDAVAVALGRTLGAAKIIFMTTADGLIVDGALARQIPVNDLAAALKRGAVDERLLSKARHAVEACEAGVPRVHVINGHVNDGLLAEVFSNEGIGTLVYANEYQEIRPARRNDVRIIELLIHSSIESEELAPRTRQSIEERLDDFYILEVDRNPIACVALHVHHPEDLGELACLYVHPSHGNRGIGQKMMQFVEDQARERKLKRLLALSTQAFNFFRTKGGYELGTPDDLPPPRRAAYDESGRRSKVLIKRLDTPPPPR